MQPFLFKVDKHFYGSRLAMVEGHRLPSVPLGLFSIDERSHWATRLGDNDP